jgi:signal peptidase I
MGNNTGFANQLKELFEWIKAIALAIIITMLIRAFVFEPVKVVGSSMENTLHSGERLFIYKLGYYFTPPERGDIIVLETANMESSLLDKIPLVNLLFSFSGNVDYIKRVVGLPGEYVDIVDGSVFINNEKLDEPYAKGITYAKGMDLPVRIPDNCYFVAGDNRENSRDSREIGFIPREKIKGKAVFRVWPFDSAGLLK